MPPVAVSALAGAVAALTVLIGPSLAVLAVLPAACFALAGRPHEPIGARVSRPLAFVLPVATAALVVGFLDAGTVMRTRAWRVRDRERYRRGGQMHTDRLP
jgi:hypothetical protein